MTDSRPLLHLLSASHSVSGADVARRMGVTRAAVWKQVDALRRRGLPIEGQAGSGYSLAWPVQLLDRDAISAALPATCAGPLELHWELDSTSSELLRRQASLADLAVILAESQHGGRGRRGRNWLSPPALNIYLSCLKRFDRGFATLAGLSLAVGVAVMRALEDLNIHGAGLKWPNDILAHGAKLAGMLVELSGEYQGPCTAVVGIGLNVRMPLALRAQAAQPVTDLAELGAGNPPPRNQVATCMIARLRECLLTFEQHGFGAFAQDYARFDLLQGQALRVSGAQGTFEGVGLGVDPRGALRVGTKTGEVIVDSADVSVRCL